MKWPNNFVNGQTLVKIFGHLSMYFMFLILNSAYAIIFKDILYFTEGSKSKEIFALYFLAIIYVSCTLYSGPLSNPQLWEAMD